MNPEKNELLSDEKFEQFYFELIEDVFVSVVDAASMKACGMIIGAHGWMESIATLDAATKNKASQRFKIVGATELGNKINSWLQSKGRVVDACKLYSHPIEVIFLPGEGKTRVAASQNSSHQIAAKKTIDVLIVDDSKTIRQLLTKVLESDPQIRVVGLAEKPSQVEELILSKKPDVITLDIHMPEMDGVSLLRQIAPKYKIPTVMITSVSLQEGPMILEALEVGAVDYIQKPSMEELSYVGPMIIEKIKTAVSAKVNLAAKDQSQSRIAKRAFDARALIAIGSSTGGTEALRAILTRLPAEIPPIVIVQHIPAVFSKAFADRMNQLCPFEVIEAKHNDEVKANRVIIAPGGMQMKVMQSSEGALRVLVDEFAEPVNRHKPSVDYTFDSLVNVKGRKGIGIILTGMGADGAKGLLNLKKHGYRTIAQDEKSCVVFGMPKEAIKLGAAEEICNLDKIPDMIMSWLSSPLMRAS